MRSGNKIFIYAMLLSFMLTTLFPYSPSFSAGKTIIQANIKSSFLGILGKLCCECAKDPEETEDAEDLLELSKLLEDFILPFQTHSIGDIGALKFFALHSNPNYFHFLEVSSPPPKFS